MMFYDDRDQLVQLTNSTLSTLKQEFKKQAEVPELERCDSLGQQLLRLLSKLCYWAEHEHITVLALCLSTFTDALPRTVSRKTYCYYPALSLMYAGGLAALACSRHDILNALFTGSPAFAEDKPLCRTLLPVSIYNDGNGAVHVLEHLREYLPGQIEDFIFPADLKKLFSVMVFLHLVALCDYGLQSNSLSDLLKKNDFAGLTQFANFAHTEIQMLYVSPGNNTKLLISGGMCGGSQDRFGEALKYALDLSRYS